MTREQPTGLTGFCCGNTRGTGFQPVARIRHHRETGAAGWKPAPRLQLKSFLQQELIVNGESHYSSLSVVIARSSPHLLSVNPRQSPALQALPASQAVAEFSHR